MTNLEKLREINPNISIYTVHDKEFVPYGQVIDNLDTAQIVDAGKKLIEAGATGYTASVPEFECLEIHSIIRDRLFGQMPTETGMVCGTNNKLNALEWHKNSEVNIAVDDIVLLLGQLDEMEEGTFHSDKVKAFYLKKGEAVEVYATSLHFCPCTVKKSGMGCIVGLPLGTNTALDSPATDRFLWVKNKWLICHHENKALIDKGVEGNIFGENITLNCID